MTDSPPTDKTIREGDGQVTDPDPEKSKTLTRRNILLSSLAGSLTLAGTSAENVSAQQSSALANFGDATGSNPDGTPEMFKIGKNENTQIEVTWQELAPGQQVFIRFAVMPVGGSWEQLGETAFVVDQASGSEAIPITEFSESERDLTSHSEINASDFKIEKDMAELENKDNRTVSKDYHLRVKIETGTGTVIADAVDTITATFGLSAGFGQNFGYNFGRTKPTSSFGE